MNLRPITLNDAPMLYRWRVDEDSRRNSITKHIFTGQTHVGWLCEQLAKNAPMFIGEWGGQAVGVVYFTPHRTALDDKKSAHRDDYIVSLTIAPECRNKGHGKDLLRVALTKIDKPCEAEILDHNAGSQRVFEQCGFVAYEKNPASTRYKWEPHVG